MTDMKRDASGTDPRPVSILALTARIVSAYTRRNAVPDGELPALIDRVFQSLAGVTIGPAAAPETPSLPAVPVKRSVFADHIVCLEDGRKLKMLKRHLMRSYGLTPHAYRERWGLPPDYPMVAPDYAERRSALAKSIGLGRKPRDAAAVEALADEQQVTPAPRTRGRKPARAAESREG